MMRFFRNILVFGVVALSAVACEMDGDLIDITINEGTSAGGENRLMPSCLVEPRNTSRASKQGIATRSLVDQITTKRLESNILRIDEDLDEWNDGCYTFTGNDATAPYATNWNKALLLEATVTAAPDNTEGIHYRSISLAPEQSYKLNIVEEKVDEKIKSDTTHFYHTRLVGWYPMTCSLPRREGVPATAQFDFSEFDAVRLNERVEIDGVPTDVVALQFKGLDGETDLMVSNLCEGQYWHKYNPNDPHKSDVHPVDGSSIYRQPFGHSSTTPVYSNYMTYRHYRSAIRLTAYAEQSDQNLIMWGSINAVVIRNQPTSCKVWLPTKLGEFGEVYHWGDYENLPIVTTPMFDNDSNHPGYNEAVQYPISMKGASLDNDIYLGYSLVEPNRDVELELHTSSGVYATTIKAQHTVKDQDGNESVVNIFEEGCIYNIKLNLHTSGSIGAILEREGDERYYDLSALHEFEIHDEPLDQNIVSTYKLSNCYILDPNEYKDAQGNDIYDGYCILASVVGNGEAGIVSSGAQTLYPEVENISPVTAHLLWESQLGLISDIELKYGYVRFKLPDSSSRGNAVIAVYDKDGKVLWSWHIWITDRPAEHSFSVGEHTITLLDRNLGATKATCSNASDALATYGLYYQWGRKDPSMGPPTYNYSPINLNTAPYYDFSSDEKTAAEVTQFAQPTLRNGVEYPMYLILPTGQPLSYIFNWLYQRYDFLWGYDSATGMTSKTIYDPCPYGYRVPSSELGALFSMGSGSAGTYGYTRTVDGKQFFFPYAGFKGVDVGLNSLICSWKYVGQKGDYQTSMYCTDADAVNNGDINQYMHRSRVYVSSATEWTEVNVGTYNGNLHIDFANRRTATSVRCVKDEKIGSITATLTPSVRNLVANTQITLDYKAHSYGSAIESITIRADYIDTSGVERNRVIRTINDIDEYVTNGRVPYTTPSDCNDSGVVFHLVVRNEHGLVYTEEVTLVSDNLSIAFNRWEDTLQSGVNNTTREFVVVGEEIRYYVNVSASSEPSLVTIGGAVATKSGTFAGQDVSNTTWYVTWSKDIKGIYDMEVAATLNGRTVRVQTPSVTVYGLVVGSRTNTIDTSGDKLYLLVNTSYSNTSMTSVGTSLAANANRDYYNLFSVESNKIKSLARGQYLNGTTGTINFSSSGTNYTITTSGNSQQIYYRSGVRSYYICQTNSTSISLSTSSSSNRKWEFYPVSYDKP